MRVFAIGDLHLSFGEKVLLDNLHEATAAKPMDIFGAQWYRHFDLIAANWQRMVRDEDLVLLPGDLSWATKPEDAVFDLDFIGQLPGIKILIKGNHDYWWQAIGKVRRLLPPGMIALQNDCFAAGDIAVCGTRGWLCPGEMDDTKIYLRELQRLELSLKSAVQAGFTNYLVMLHYPPAAGSVPDAGFMALLLKYGVKTCVYGHLHNADSRQVLAAAGGISFYLVACDYIGFSPLLICEAAASKSGLEENME